MNRLQNSAFTIAESMWNTMKSEIEAGQGNTPAYFHAKSILLNSLSYIEGWGRKDSRDEQKGSPKRNEAESMKESREEDGTDS